MKNEKIEVNILNVDVMSGLVNVLVEDYDNLPEKVKEYLDSNFKDK